MKKKKQKKLRPGWAIIPPIKTEGRNPGFVKNPEEEKRRERYKQQREREDNGDT